MVDINTGVRPQFLREEDLRNGMELLFYAYRDFTAEPDAILADYKFGRAHHRVIHFVGGNPGITVSELLSILKITKQSLSRVLSQLVREGFVTQTAGTVDRRQRLLELTQVGIELERQLSQSQRERIARAYREAGTCRHLSSTTEFRNSAAANGVWLQYCCRALVDKLSKPPATGFDFPGGDWHLCLPAKPSVAI